MNLLIIMAIKVKIRINMEKNPIYLSYLIIKTGSRTKSNIAE
jgi:hypothetical protein